MSDELYEHESTIQISREQAAAKLRELADSLERQNSVRVAHGDRDIDVKVADVVEYEFEVEVEEDKHEIEISISW